MAARRAARTTLGAALREKFKSPREALKRLGIDESVLSEPGLAYDGANKMSKSNRLQYLLVTRTARIFNPQLAVDAKVEYGPLFKGVTTKNIKAKTPTIISDAKKLLKGKTLAKDASVEGLATLLHHLENPPQEASLDESVSPEQHNAMEAAAHGHSNLGIPKDVGKEFERADKGKSFVDALPEFLRSKGVDESIIADAMALNEPAESALGSTDAENEEVDIEVEEGEDAEIEQEEGEDERTDEERAADKAAEDKAAKDKAARDKAAKDNRRGAMDKKFITVDESNKAIEAAIKTVRKDQADMMTAREFVRPFVGELNMALDTAEKVYRGAAESLGIENADTIHVSALPQMIKLFGTKKSTTAADVDDMAHDSAASKGFNERFPGAARIGTA